jgi:hypothetical protein
MSDRGVNEKTNTFGYATERKSDGYDGRFFSINAPEMRAALWQALRKSRYIVTSPTFPKAPYIFVVLHRSPAVSRVGEALIVDSRGFAHLPVDPYATKQTYRVFWAPELRELLVSYAEKFGKQSPQ